MFTQTNDHGNWQARYIVQNPYGGSVAECSERVGVMDCAAMCSGRVSAVRAALGPDDALGPNERPEQSPRAAEENLPSVTVRGFTRSSLAAYRGKTTEVLRDECVSACRASKAQGLEAAIRYYQSDLPDRVAKEKQTLAELTGWSLHDIDAMPGAQL